MDFVIDSLGEQTIARQLIRLNGRIDDLRPAMESIIRQVRAGEERQFDSQGGYGSGGWAKLKESTKAFKARNNLDPRILHATGDLRESLTSDKKGGFAITRFDGLDFGTTIPYAEFHQKGKGVPVRRPAQFPESDRRAWVKTIQDHVLGTGTL